MSKHLIGIDAEVYILYKDNVLLESSKKNVDFRHCLFLFFFVEFYFFPFMNDVCSQQIQSFQVLKFGFFLFKEKKQKKHLLSRF